MSSIAPPDGWEIVTGTWGTDADREDTIVYSGIHSIHLENTTVATKVRTPVSMQVASNLFGITNASSPYGQWFYIKQVDDGNVLNTVKVICERYDLTGTLLSSATIFNSRLGTSGNWYIVGDNTYTSSTTPGYFRYTIEKAARAFDVYIDSGFSQQNPPWFMMTGFNSGTDSTLSLTDDASYHTLPFNQATGEDTLFSGTYNSALIQVPGVYTINAQLNGSVITTKLLWRLNVSFINDIGSQNYFYGPTLFGSNDHTAFGAINITIPLAYAATVTMEYSTGGTGAATVKFSTDNSAGVVMSRYTWLMGSYVGR